MNKKIIALIVVVLLIVGGVGLAIFMQANNNSTNNAETNNSTTTNNDKTISNDTQNSSQENSSNNIEESNSKSVVVYFSATGTTKNVAEKIKDVTGADIIEIKPKQEYTSADLNYNNDDCRANIEQNDKNARPEIANKIDVSDYDTIYLGYPIWWGTAPKIIFTLLDNTDMSGKTVLPFATSGGSGISQSVRDLKSYKSDINWKDGKLFNGSISNSDITNWNK